MFPSDEPVQIPLLDVILKVLPDSATKLPVPV
jgi:hypothetical protein